MNRFFCRHHRQAQAGWSCEQCRAKLCLDCVAEKTIDKLCVEVCATCGERVARLVHHRADIASYEARVRASWKYPFSLGGVVGMVAIGVIFAIGTIGLPYLALAFAIFWGFIFVLIQSTAQGEDDIGPPDFSTLWESVIEVLFRAIMASIASWIPLAWYVWKVKPSFAEALASPLVWLCVLFGIVYSPMAVIGAAVKVPLWRMFNPVWMVSCAARLGRDYGIAVGALGFLTVLQGFVAFLALQFLRIPFPLVPVVLAVTLMTYIPFVMARVLGLLLYIRGDKLGYGDENDYYERAFVARPRGVVPNLEVHKGDLPELSAKEKTQPIEVDF